jgi:hypothetical protein
MHNRLPISTRPFIYRHPSVDQHPDQTSYTHRNDSLNPNLWSSSTSIDKNNQPVRGSRSSYSSLNNPSVSNHQLNYASIDKNNQPVRGSRSSYSSLNNPSVSNHQLNYASIDKNNRPVRGSRSSYTHRNDSFNPDLWSSSTSIDKNNRPVRGSWSSYSSLNNPSVSNHQLNYIPIDNNLNTSRQLVPYKPKDIVPYKPKDIVPYKPKDIVSNNLANKAQQNSDTVDNGPGSYDNGQMEDAVECFFRALHGSDTNGEEADSDVANSVASISHFPNTDDKRKGNFLKSLAKKTKDFVFYKIPILKTENPRAVNINENAHVALGLLKSDQNGKGAYVRFRDYINGGEMGETIKMSQDLVNYFLREVTKSKNGILPNGEERNWNNSAKAVALKFKKDLGVNHKVIEKFLVNMFLECLQSSVPNFISNTNKNSNPSNSNKNFAGKLKDANMAMLNKFEDYMTALAYDRNRRKFLEPLQKVVYTTSVFKDNPTENDLARAVTDVMHSTNCNKIKFPEELEKLLKQKSLRTICNSLISSGRKVRFSECDPIGDDYLWLIYDKKISTKCLLCFDQYWYWVFRFDANGGIRLYSLCKGHAACSFNHSIRVDMKGGGENKSILRTIDRSNATEKRIADTLKAIFQCIDPHCVEISKIDQVARLYVGYNRYAFYLGRDILGYYKLLLDIDNITKYEELLILVHLELIAFIIKFWDDSVPENITDLIKRHYKTIVEMDNQRCRNFKNIQHNQIGFDYMSLLNLVLSHRVQNDKMFSGIKDLISSKYKSMIILLNYFLASFDTFKGEIHTHMNKCKDAYIELMAVSVTSEILMLMSKCYVIHQTPK